MTAFVASPFKRVTRLDLGGAITWTVVEETGSATSEWASNLGCPPNIALISGGPGYRLILDSSQTGLEYPSYSAFYTIKGKDSEAFLYVEQSLYCLGFVDIHYELRNLPLGTNTSTFYANSSHNETLITTIDGSPMTFDPEQPLKNRWTFWVMGSSASGLTVGEEATITPGFAP